MRNVLLRFVRCLAGFGLAAAAPLTAAQQGIANTLANLVAQYSAK